MKHITMLQMAEKLTPNKLFKAPIQEKQVYLQDWINNGYWLGGSISPHTILETTFKCQKAFEDQQIMAKITLPTLMIKGKRDTTVSNDAIDSEFQNLRSIDKTLAEFDVDHFVWQDGEHL